VPVEKLIVMVEEPSMEIALETLLPKLLRQGIQFELRQFGCKSELLKRLPERLSAYASWLPKETLILVVVDRDDEDCKALKARLNAAASNAGLVTKSAPKRGYFQVINRIAIEELEAWFWGDWNAVRSAYPKLDTSVPQRAGLRNPDAIKGGTWEALERQLQVKGYFKQGLRKLELARTVSALMDPSKNRSASFGCLRDTLAAL
jgi:hypothetical protein